MGELETLAAERGVTTLMLETGVKQDAARALYTALGYTECGPVGCYESNAISVFMRKTLMHRGA
jgi:putative acetyltransferase